MAVVARRPPHDDHDDDSLAGVYAELGYDPATGTFGGGLLRAWVLGRGMTVVEFCQRAGIDEDTFTKIEKGRRPRPQTVIRILTTLSRVPPLRLRR
jgi:hypothetical protein